MSIPDWLTKEFLEKLLEADQIDTAIKIQITKYDVISAFPKGLNYLSNILRVTVEYKDNITKSIQKISLIIKMPLQDGSLASLNKGGINEKEFQAYYELLPKLNSIIQSSEPGIHVTPKLYETEIEGVVILEDLAEKGYKMGNRNEQLDYEHAVLVLENLARFHAASVRLREIEPNLIEKFGVDLVICKNMDEDIKNQLDPIMGEIHLHMVCEEFKKWPETIRFVEFLSKLKSKVWDLYIMCTSPCDGEFAALNHGDVWTNNILFKYNKDNKPESLKFVDYQLLRYVTPTMDLLNFLYTSVPCNVLETQFHDLTKIYFEKLNIYLENYGCSNRLSEEDYEKSLEKMGIFSLLQCINALPFMYAEYNKDENSESDKSTEDIPTSDMLKNKKFISVCSKYLETFSKTAWFQRF